MKNYSNTFQFNLVDASTTKKRLFTYFDHYNFKNKTLNENEFLFFKKGSLFNGWKLNPLNQTSEIKVKITEANEVIIISNFEGVYITPIAFTVFFEGFFVNLKRFVLQNISFKEANSFIIKDAKQQMLTYWGILFLGMLCSIYLGHQLANYFDFRLLRLLVVIIGYKIIGFIFQKYFVSKYSKNTKMSV